VTADIFESESMIPLKTPREFRNKSLKMIRLGVLQLEV